MSTHFPFHITVHAPKPVVTYSSRNIHSVIMASFEDDLCKSMLFSVHSTRWQAQRLRRPAQSPLDSHTSSDQQVAVDRSRRCEAFPPPPWMAEVHTAQLARKPIRPNTVEHCQKPNQLINKQVEVNLLPSTHPRSWFQPQTSLINS